jgi:phosphoribosylaminoimidazole-succinocarboxamide synthase
LLVSQPSRFFSPAETARRLKVSTKALRLYERLGLVKPVRTSTGWRTYGPDQMVRLHQVLALKHPGLPLRRVGELLGDQLADLDAVLLLQESALRARIADDASRLELLVAVRRRLADGETLSVDDLIHLTRETVMTDLPELPNHYEGKVRDNYDLPDGRRVIVASDRLSAFDLNLCAVPYKGQVLTQTARYGFDVTGDICPNHVIAYPDPNVLVCRRLEMLPVEMVVRGYLAGTTSTSVLTLYQAGQREMYGVRLPDGMRPNQALPAPILTPTSKAAHGDHDAPLSPAQILEQGLLTADQWDELSAIALALYARGRELAATRGLILADTKYEFGLDTGGRIVLADEIHTPDSSRFWRSATYEDRFVKGERPDSFDKDFVRSWVAARCDPYKDPIPEIPREIILATSDVYIEAFETITGQPFVKPDAGEPVLARVRRNLALYMGTGA